MYSLSFRLQRYIPLYNRLTPVSDRPFSIKATLLHTEAKWLEKDNYFVEDTWVLFLRFLDD